MPTERERCAAKRRRRCENCPERFGRRRTARLRKLRAKAEQRARKPTDALSPTSSCRSEFAWRRSVKQVAGISCQARTFFPRRPMLRTMLWCISSSKSMVVGQGSGPPRGSAMSLNDRPGWIRQPWALPCALTTTAMLPSFQLDGGTRLGKRTEAQTFCCFLVEESRARTG